MNTIPKLKDLISKLRLIVSHNLVYDTTISLNLNVEIHCFNSFHHIAIAIECLKPLVTKQRNDQILVEIFDQRHSLNLPPSIRDSKNIDEFKIQLQKPFVIIENPAFMLRISIYDSVNNHMIKNGLLKLLAVHNPDYNLIPKRTTTFYSEENTIFELINSIILCRVYGNVITEDERNIYEWNGYRLVTEVFNNSLIENLISFYRIKDQESDLRYN